MKIFKYTFVFFLLTLNLRLYSYNNATSVNNFYITNFNINSDNENVIVEDKYDPKDEGSWQKKAVETDDTYSFRYWLSNVSVLTSGLFCGLSFFLFTEWFLLLATILGLLYVIHFFVQIISPTALCLLNFETKEKFERYASKSNPEIKSVVTYEREYKETNSKGEEETKKELIETKSEKVSNFLTFEREIVCNFEKKNKPLTKCKIDLFINRKGSIYPFILDRILGGVFEIQKKEIKHCCKDKKHRIKRSVHWNVPNIGNYMLISNGISLKPWHVSFWWFLLFTILPFSQFYKLWVDRYCDEGAAKITYTIADHNIPIFLSKYV